MKRANVVVWGLALGLGAWACGRQVLDLAPLAGGAAGAAGALGGAGALGVAGALGAGGAGGTPGASRMTAVAAAAPAPDTFGRECTAASQCSWWQDPDPRLLCCAGACANTAGDSLNCGACGHVCAHGQNCVAGRCGAPATPEVGQKGGGTSGNDCTGVVCDVGEICCDHLCVAVASNNQNCGACGAACRFDGVSCIVGSCCPSTPTAGPCHFATCGGSLVACKNGCKDLGGDPDNCGACGAVCPPTARMCWSGICLGG